MKTMHSQLGRGRVSARLAWGFGLLMLLMIVVSGYSIKTLYQTTSALDRLANREWRLMRAASDWSAVVDLNVLRVSASARLGSGEYVDQLNAEYSASAKQMERIKGEFEAVLSDDAARAQYAAILQTNVRFDQIVAQVKSKQEAADFVGLEGLLRGDFERSRKEYLDAVRGIQAAALSQANQAVAQAESDTRSAAAVALILVVASQLFAGLFGWRLSRSIALPLRDAVASATSIAGGDLSADVAMTSGGEVGALQQALAEMQDGLRTLVGQVFRSTDSIASASTQIASGSQDLSNRSEQAAASLEETASSMKELTGAVAQTADSARQAIALSASAREVAGRGGSVITQVVDTMSEIHAASKKISEIIGVIDGIAFQTNILALNAAVEAARAGEQGRGFAVVAGEVRSLAQNSAQAAKEIRTLITSSAERVDVGTRLAQDAGTTMQDIVTSVQRVSDIVSEISAAAQEQRGGIGQVDQAITHLDNMTQQNAALVEESAAAASSLKTQAGELASLVSRFKLTDMPQRPSLSAAAPSASRASPAPARTAAQALARVATPKLAAVAAASAAGSAASVPTDEWASF